MYKLCPPPFGSDKSVSVIRLSDNACIPFDPANRDFEQFKQDVASGTPLEDPDGNVMTQDEVNAFLETLP